jgi:release factor glutamine methyltransferase
VSLTVKSAKALGLESGIDLVDVEVLLCAALEKERSFLFAWPEKELTDDQRLRFQQYLNARLQGQPVAYIVGVREFWSLPIQTTSATLIPRPDTEVLVETVLEYFDGGSRCCIDLGTGTGAIALALQSERPAWVVEAVDRIESAVELAKDNAVKLRLPVQCRVGSWLEDVTAQSMDIIVSNPPYIDAADEHLKQGDVRFEPKTALISDDDGLADIKVIIRQSVSALKPGGGLFLEHGWQQAQAVRALLLQAGFANVATRRDYGGNERISFGFRC